MTSPRVRRVAALAQSWYSPSAFSQVSRQAAIAPRRHFAPGGGADTIARSDVQMGEALARTVSSRQAERAAQSLRITGEIRAGWLQHPVHGLLAQHNQALVPRCRSTPSATARSNTDRRAPAGARSARRYRRRICRRDSARQEDPRSCSTPAAASVRRALRGALLQSQASSPCSCSIQRRRTRESDVMGNQVPAVLGTLSESCRTSRAETQRHRSDFQQALAADIRCSDHRGVRLSQLRVGYVDRNVRAARNTGRDRREAAQRNAHSSEGSGGRGTHGKSGGPDHRRFSRGARCFGLQGDPAIHAGRAGTRTQARVMELEAA